VPILSTFFTSLFLIVIAKKTLNEKKWLTHNALKSSEKIKPTQFPKATILQRTLVFLLQVGLLLRAMRQISSWFTKEVLCKK
jgi:hypothetical protein